MTKEEKIIEACKKEASKDPLEIFHSIVGKCGVSIHGPEHHVLDGACVLTAFRNAGGNVDLDSALETLLQRGLKMPGAACGYWGVCGAVMSVGAALSIIENTGPLTTDDSWGSHMHYTSEALGKLAEVGGPRCCKRNAFLAIKAVIPYIRDRFGIELGEQETACGFSPQNQQCIKERCPFFKR
ncbi:MAG: hypothetical protein J5535_04665 [Firmicutes bacterium]|nr:hypothetical protein [Bacillota bacterium]